MYIDRLAQWADESMMQPAGPADGQTDRQTETKADIKTETEGHAETETDGPAVTLRNKAIVGQQKKPSGGKFLVCCWRKAVALVLRSVDAWDQKTVIET